MTCAAGLIRPRRDDAPPPPSVPRAFLVAAGALVRHCWRRPPRSRPLPCAATVGAPRHHCRWRLSLPSPLVGPVPPVTALSLGRHRWCRPRPPSQVSPSAVTVGAAGLPRRSPRPRPSSSVPPASPVAAPLRRPSLLVPPASSVVAPSLGRHRRCRVPPPSLPSPPGRHHCCHPPLLSPPPPSAAIIVPARLLCRVRLPRSSPLVRRVSPVALVSLCCHRRRLSPCR